MRCVTAVIATSLFLSLSVSTGAVAASPDLGEIIAGETPEQLCDRLAPDPFAGFGPDEWARPFGTRAPRGVPLRSRRRHGQCRRQ